MKITLNSDQKIIKDIKQKLEDNGGFCPCSLIKNEDTKCMCKEFREQKESGFCHCMLYYKEVENG